MLVAIDNRQALYEVEEDFITEIIKSTFHYLKFKEKYEVSISLVDNGEIAKLNKHYRQKEYATDVLSFPMLNLTKGVTCEEELSKYYMPFKDIDIELPIGDIVISMEKVEEQSKAYAHSFHRELAFLLIHGILHLLGYDHERSVDEEKKMFGLQEDILMTLKIVR